MAIRKKRGKWAYYFDAPGSSREKRVQITGAGFGTKKAAVDAESERRIKVREEYEARERGVVGTVPLTLSALLDTFCTQHADRELVPKTAERYRDYIGYLHADLLAFRLLELTPLHFTREWTRLRESGGRHRKTKTPRPLSGKSVRDIAGFVSSAFSYGVGQGVAIFNPVTASVRPRGGARRPSIAMNQDQQQLLIEGSTHWVLPVILEVCAGLGARRGEVLAFRWTDIRSGAVTIERVLCQIRGGIVFFKEAPKSNAGFRTISIPESTLAILEKHRAAQMELRASFGPDYKTDLDLVFCQPDGSPLKPDSISSAASLLYRKLNLPVGSSLHGLRHTHGSQLIAKGVDIPTVSKRLGHSSPAVTMRIYAHMLQGTDAEAAKIWDLQRKPKAEDDKDLIQ